jgi:hypothetical protein
MQLAVCQVMGKYIGYKISKNNSSLALLYNTAMLLPCKVELCTVATILAWKEVFARHRHDVEVQ